MNFFFEKIWLIFDIENWLWKYDFGTFQQAVTHWRIFKKNPLSMLILGQKSCFLGPTIFKIPQPNWHYNVHTRLLEESVEKATWLVCTGIQANRASGNLLDFLIRWLKTAKNINDNFRFWIICEGIDALTLTTVQKCCSNFLGNEGSDDFKDAKDGEIPISAFAEAKERYYIDKFLIFLFHENQFV